MSFEQTILDGFNRVLVNRALEVNGLPAESSAWIFKNEDSIGIAIPLGATAIDYYGKSTNITIKTEPDFTIGRQKGFLVLSCATISLTYQFAKICDDFITPEKRTTILDNPDEWWQGWRNLMGDKIQEKKIYDVLAELMVCEYLKRTNVPFDWQGPQRATIDIESTDKSYEVKSTLQRDSWVFTASSERQLDFERRGDRENPKPLSLVICQMEQSEAGRSINDVMTSLRTMGADYERLESLLAIAFPIGSPERNEKFILWRMKEFNVDNNFPRITPELLAQSNLPHEIVSIRSYEVDLTNYPGNELNLN